MKKVTGIGGVFFKCKDPNKMKEWYKTHLGLNTNDYGATFEWREADDSTQKGSTTWSPFAETTKNFEPSTKDFMINYRVADLEALVDELKKEGVTIVDTMETYDFGKFVQRNEYVVRKCNVAPLQRKTTRQHCSLTALRRKQQHTQTRYEPNAHLRPL